ncbi:MAG TPA: hypothetical protein VG845_08085 [Dehalococcoidia bacterium]|jgi:DNA-directed RNA polymerase subunit RPC12/RpoP|nr:hypothetical protein [Dehalococcoidia bacterium]
MTVQAFDGTRLRSHLYKACQRCGGDLMLDRDVDYGDRHATISYVCLQCGRHTPLRALLPQATRGVGVPARAA